MTDVLDRFHGRATPPDAEADPSVPTSARPSASGLGVGPRVLVATLSVAAAVIHVAMVPARVGESALEGWGFLLSGWLQLALAAWVVARPSRVVPALIAAVNVVLIGLWMVSRTAGLPVGAHAGVAEAASFVDITCVAFEGAVVAVALALLARPALGRRWSAPTLVLASVVPLNAAT